jgi:DNA polymerase-3 subunit gamma/tau
VPITSSESTSHAGAKQYVVVARRYRPQTFEELVGQEHVGKALSNAIASNRVGHAYLFTGARGVGKTSAARILAKALNCEKGPTPVPCNVCDICRSISAGEDVDVLEIDGASNRGIDEIRQLRQNVNVRPSRARYKIYIIDEVHMLTREAFNALLKTLEEPPEHVKFIFCTTEAGKIPITILSRCQRFDFAGIITTSIVRRLQQIVEAEGVSAEIEALETLARRAAGSMRDSQSLLEQLLAFSPGRITLADVHSMLGTAADESLTALVQQLIEQDAAAALATLDAALGMGVDVGQLIEQLLGYFRDCMVTAAGCGPESLLYCSSASRGKIVEAGKRLGLHTILAALQILDETLARMRVSTQGRVLAELALVRISQLAHLDELAELVAGLQAGTIEVTASAAALPAPAPRSLPAAGPPPEAMAAKKNDELTQVTPSAMGTPGPPSRPAWQLSPENATEVWSTALTGLTGMAADYAREFERVGMAGPQHLVVSFKPGYAVAKSICERPDQLDRFEQALAALTGQRVRVEFSVAADAAPVMPRTGSGPVPSPDQKRVAAPSQQRIMEIMEHPMIRRAGELFGAQPAAAHIKFPENDT